MNETRRYIFEKKTIEVTSEEKLRAKRWVYKIYRTLEKCPVLLTLLYRCKDYISRRQEKERLMERLIMVEETACRKKEVKQIHNLKIAAILDTFSYFSFKDEANFIMITPQDWLDVFEQEKPDLFFCESAWGGMDAKKLPWRGKIYTSIYFSQENRKVLLSILKYCKEHEIPTVFWNKEDPAHYEDQAHNFAATAVLFDHVFTTAQECVKLYRQMYGHKSVHTLMFGVQPKMFNPIEKYDRMDEVVFAGSWYAYHKERCRQMTEIFDKILQAGKRLVIYNRFYKDADPNHIFPKKYDAYIKPALEYQELDRAYKGSRYALNITTVTNSETMFARRIFELAASNTSILSNYSQGIDAVFGDHIVYTNQMLRFEGMEQKQEYNLYQVLLHHTYECRLQQILNNIGFQYEESSKKIAVFYLVKDVEDLREVQAHFRQIGYTGKKMKVLSDKCIKPDIKLLLQARCAAERIDFMEVSDVWLEEECAYFILATPALRFDFIEKAICHFSYLDENVFVGRGSCKYLYRESKQIANLVGKAKMFPLLQKYIKGKNLCEIKYYVI